MFDELSVKYKKVNAHIKNKQNRKVKSELLISPRQADVLLVGRCKDSKQSKSSSKGNPHSHYRRERKLHTSTSFPPSKHSMPKSWGPSPMMFHHYAPWFDWYALLMQYESFYPRSVKHEPNAFDRSARLRKDRFSIKSRLNVPKTQE
jgi:hypothetical protein